MPDNEVFAPGWPGTPSRWTSSDKSGVGTALSRASHVWFTLSHGILTEVYYPRLDWACIRDLGLLVTDGHTFFSEEKCDARHAVDYLAEGVPAYRLTNTCLQGRYRIEKEVVADPERDVILQRIRFVPLQGSLDDYHLYVLLAPHLGNQGAGNTAWLGETKGEPMLFAERSGTALALAASVPWVARSVGYVGVSDGWQDLQQHQRLTWRYTRAENGNVAMVGEIDPASAADGFILALAFAPHALGAGHLARASLQDGFEAARQAYIRGWAEWQQTLLASEGMEDAGHNQLNFYRISTAVLHTHEAKEFAGGTIASLSIPWGYAKGDNDLDGYHLVWTRAMAETIGGLLAAGARTSVRRVLGYLQATQEADGRWPQNMWLDGTAYWNGVQMDEVGFPVLLCDLAWRQGVLTRADMIRTWPMVRRAAAFLVRHGPVTGQDRWEEDPGYAPFTLAVEIVALLAAAELAELAAGRPHEALRLLHAMEAFANAGGMLPEQIWDKPDIPAQDLVFGRPSGSATPLVWAHAEYLKLRRSIQEGRVMDMPPQALQRYGRDRTGSPYTIWRFNHKCRWMPAGKTLRVEVLAPAVVQWTTDGWVTGTASPTRANQVAIHLVDVPTPPLPAGTVIGLSFYWPETETWEPTKFAVEIR